MLRTLTSFFASTLIALSFSVGAQAAVSTFENLPLAPESHLSEAPDSTFTSGDATFTHNYLQQFGCCWDGWSYSNRTDTTTAGYTNEYSAYSSHVTDANQIVRAGQGGSANYVVAYNGGPIEATFSMPTLVSSAYFTNTTYAVLSMRQGDQFAKKFGGATGNDPDFLKVTIQGFNGASSTGLVDFYLADYRFSDNAMDYMVTDWTSVNLSALGSVTKLAFSVSASDSGTPAYFAMDTLVAAPVPEPEQAAMLLAGLALLGGVVRKRAAKRTA